jgi:hypothetical protein
MDSAHNLENCPYCGQPRTEDHKVIYSRNGAYVTCYNSSTLRAPIPPALRTEFETKFQQLLKAKETKAAAELLCGYIVASINPDEFARLLVDAAKNYMRAHPCPR